MIDEDLVGRMKAGAWTKDEGCQRYLKTSTKVRGLIRSLFAEEIAFGVPLYSVTKYVRLL